jgi:hypothetical protein
MIAAGRGGAAARGGSENTQHDALLFSGLTGVDLGVAWSGQTGEPGRHSRDAVGLVALDLAERTQGRHRRRRRRQVVRRDHAAAHALRTGFLRAGAGVEIGATIRDLCFVDYNEDEVADVAVLTDTELRIVDLTGTTLFSLALAAPGGAIEPVPQLTQRHSLALLRRKVAPAGWELVHISQAAVDKRRKRSRCWSPTTCSAAWARATSTATHLRPRDPGRRQRGAAGAQPRGGATLRRRRHRSAGDHRQRRQRPGAGQRVRLRPRRLR